MCRSRSLSVTSVGLHLVTELFMCMCFGAWYGCIYGHTMCSAENCCKCAAGMTRRGASRGCRRCGSLRPAASRGAAERGAFGREPASAFSPENKPLLSRSVRRNNSSESCAVLSSVFCLLLR